MAQPRCLERLTAQDLLKWMLPVDDFGWSEDIGVLAILDGTRLLTLTAASGSTRSAGGWSRGSTCRASGSRCTGRDGDWPGFPCGSTPQLRPRRPRVVHPVPAPGDEAQLLAACARLYRRRLDLTRPLWQAWLLPGLPQRRVGLFLRVHHAMVDGVADGGPGGAAGPGCRRAHAGRAAVDPGADPERRRAVPRQPAPAPAGAGSRAVGPGPSAPAAGRLVAWREFLAERAPHQPQPPDRGGTPAGHRPRPFEVAQQVAHAHQAKVNDVVLAAVAGGLRQPLAGRGEDVEDLVLRVMVPVSLHHHEPPGRRASRAR